MTNTFNSLVSQETINRLMTWFLLGDTGLSSTCLASTIMTSGESIKLKESVTRQHPRDASDFKRCVGLLRAVPELREHLSLMRNVSDYWLALVNHWEELEQLLDTEVQHLKENRHFVQNAADTVRGSTYRRIVEIYAPIEEKRMSSSFK